MSTTTHQEGGVNYGIAIDPEKLYPVTYQILPDGTRVEVMTFLPGKEMTENQIKQWLHFLSALKNIPTIDDLKAKYADHLGVKELDTSDAYAVEWTMKELSGTTPLAANSIENTTP